MVYWQSWGDFWAMGGYAFYVWSSLGIVGLGLLLEIWQAVRYRALVLKRLYSLFGLSRATKGVEVC